VPAFTWIVWPFTAAVTAAPTVWKLVLDIGSDRSTVRIVPEAGLIFSVAVPRLLFPEVSVTV